MSGIFGIYNRNDKPVDKEIVTAMLNGISYWQPNDRGLLLFYEPYWNNIQAFINSSFIVWLSAGSFQKAA